MTDIPNPTHTAAKGAKGAASLLKGHKPIVYGSFAVAVIVFAYIIHKRNAAAASDVMANGDTETAAAMQDGYGYPSAGSGGFPGAAEGAYYGGSTPATDTGANAHDGSSSMADFATLFAVLFPNGVPTGGGAPDRPAVDEHLPPAADTSDTSAAAPAAAATKTQAKSAAPKVTAQHAQPTLGPNIFYNSDRGLRYVVEKGNRRYESSLNKGDWGHGGVIPRGH